MNEQEIKNACTELSVGYARHVDFGEYDAFVELFTDDAVLNLGFKLEREGGDQAVDDEALTRTSLSPCDDKHSH